MIVKFHRIMQLLVVMVVTGCAVTPVEQQFLSVNSFGTVTQRPGVCDNRVFYRDRSHTDSFLDGLSPSYISLLVWNIYKGQKDGWRNDLSRLSSGIDLMLLQEVSLDADTHIFFEEQDFYWSLNSAFRLHGKDTGVLLASRVKSRESCGFQHDEPLLWVPKTIVVSSFIIQGTEKVLLAANVHGINFTLGNKAYRRQFRDLKKLLENHDGPLLVAGDFNDWKNSRQAVIKELVHNLGLSKLRFEDDRRTQFNGVPVDHIFYRGLEPVSQSVYSVSTSDHNPLFAAFRLLSEQ